jgi:GGDEF domain-containing protein
MEAEKNSVAYDNMEISGGRAVWKDVLAVYAVKTNTDKDNPQEVATMDESKKQILSDIFWEMNSISSRSESHSETEITETDDGNGNIVQTETTVTKTTLYITVSHLTVDEMADLYGFDAEQREYLAELLKDVLRAEDAVARIGGDEFANEMFEAGEKLDGKTAEEVFLQDFKVFMCGDIRFGVAQGSYMTRKNLTAAEALLKPYLEEARNKQNVEDIYMLLTDVPKEESVVICNGRYAAEVLTDGFDTQPAADASWTLPGVVSRKKQFIPALMTAYQEL